MRKISLLLLIYSILIAGSAAAQVVLLVDANDVPVGSVIDTDFELQRSTVIATGALVALEAQGQAGILVTNNAIGSLAFLFDVHFENDDCTGNAHLGIFEASEFQLRGDYFLLAGENGDLYLFDNQGEQDDGQYESWWDSSTGTCIVASGGITSTGPLTLVEAGFGAQFTPLFRMVVSSQGMLTPVPAPAVGTFGLILLALGFMLFGGIVLRRKLA